MIMQPDKLFRDKLEGFQIDTSSGVWSRVESGLESTPSRALWTKIGAAVLILTVSSVLIWNYTNPDHQNKIVTQIPIKEIENTIKESPVNSTKEIIGNQVSPITVNKQVTKNIHTPKINPPSADIAEHTIAGETDKNNFQESLPVSEIISPSIDTKIAEETSTLPPQKPVEKSTPVYIVYKAEDVNKKYLRKQPKADTISSEKKLSPFQTIVGIAYNVKTGESGIRNLREMKDEIFTLSFLDDKKNKN